jgi:Cu-processing system ATP-binding protein
VHVLSGLIEARHEHGQTVLFSSHQLGDVERLADRFLVIAGGLLVASLSAADPDRAPGRPPAC